MSPNPIDESYTTQVRQNLRAFHENLDQGNFNAIGSLIASDYYWNYDGTILLTRDVAKSAIEGAVTSALKGMRAQDIYNIVDGNRGAVLLRISGKQTGPFAGLPLQPDGGFNVKEAEHFIFNNDAKARTVVTITPIGLMKDQMTGAIEIPPAVNTTLKHSPQTSYQFREFLRRNMASLHLHANAGRLDDILKLAVEDVIVEENNAIFHGKDAFFKVVTAQNAGLGSFPEKLFHDFDVLADGNFGAITYVWQGVQRSDYMGIAPTEQGTVVDQRGMLFFEFNGDGLIVKATGVYDEDVVNATVTGKSKYLYP